MAAPGRRRPLGLVLPGVLVREAEHVSVAQGIPHQPGRLGRGTGRQLTAALPLGIHRGGGIAGLVPPPHRHHRGVRAGVPVLASLRCGRCRGSGAVGGGLAGLGALAGVRGALLPADLGRPGIDGDQAADQVQQQRQQLGIRPGLQPGRAGGA